MSGEYTPEPYSETPTTDGGVDYPAIGRAIEDATGIDFDHVNDALRGSDLEGTLGVDLPDVDIPEIVTDDSAPTEWTLNDGVSEEIAEQAAEHGVDPSEVIAQDTSIDGTPDYYYTENSDGYTTFSAFDQDQDGTLEYVSVDTDDDGNLDYSTGDTDGDGVPDSTITYP